MTVVPLADVEAPPAVRDLEGHVVLADRQAKARSGHARVLDDVRERLPRDPVELDLAGTRDRKRAFGPLDLDVEPVLVRE